MFDLKAGSKQAANIAAEHPEEFQHLRGEYDNDGLMVWPQDVLLRSPHAVPASSRYIED